MKKFAALALLAAVGASAHAQSSVTLFGIVDAAVRQTKNGSNEVTSLSSGGLSTSRLGFRGTEDLGGGLAAIFWLEHGFNVDTGTPSDANRFWNRRATVALKGAFGEVRLGRDFTPTYTAFSDFDPFGDNGVGAGGKFFNVLGTTADTNTRADNLVSYYLPDVLGGVYGQATVGAGEGVSGKRYIGGRVGYKAGPINVTGGYSTTRVTPLTGSGGADAYKTIVGAASYDFGFMKLSGYFDQKRYGPLRVSTGEVGVNVPVGPGYIRAGYTKLDAQHNLAGQPTISFNDANQIAIGYVYSLSKRTTLYGTYARVDNKRAASYIVSAPAFVGTNNGSNSTGYELGIRHAF